MASVFKPTYLRPIPLGANRTTLKSKPAVRFTDRRGKKHVRRIHVSRGGELTGKMVCEQTKWWMRYVLPDGTEKREKGFKDKVATEQEGARRERMAAGRASGLLGVDPKFVGMAIASHLKAYEQDRIRRGLDARSSRLRMRRLRRMADEVGWPTLAAITPDSMRNFMTRLKTNGSADRTINDNLHAVMTFLNWCVQHERLIANPLKHIKGVERPRNVYVRRSLSADELRRLLDAAAMGGRTAGRGNPEQRRLAYLTMAKTGLRYHECQLLQWGDIDFGGPESQSYLNLRAEATKARREEHLPMNQELARELQAAKPPEARPAERVFRSMPHYQTLHNDLKRAGIELVDDTGRHVGFHSLRITFGTLLAKAAVAPRTVSRLMRHRDINMTLKLYTDWRALSAPEEAVAMLPDLTDTGTGQADTPNRQAG